jgi:DNA invertase Pin-like site-specific DNA recombinase
MSNCLSPTPAPAVERQGPGRTSARASRSSTCANRPCSRSSTTANRRGLQYALSERAIELGWSPTQVWSSTKTKGAPGASADGRPGFQRLVGEVGLDHVGLVLGLEISRLARSSRDWYQLLEVCGLFGTLIGDADGIYDPRTYNDRLLLGLKGTMSEAELHILKQRMLEGKRAKARRGELHMLLPRGYARTPAGGEVIKTPMSRRVP